MTVGSSTIDIGGGQPPTSGDAVVAPLHAQLTSFVGRVDLLDECLAALRTTRLLTLLGPGGVGKTKVLEQLAARITATGERRVVVVYLSGIKPDDTNEQLAATIARAVGLSDNVAETPAAVLLVEHLRHQHLTIMLDNCEHLVADGDGPVPNLLRVLLRAAEGLQVVTTSRDLLRVKGETRFPVPPLCVGDTPYLDEAGEHLHEAVQLLIERARAIPREITKAEHRLAHQLCRRLDGNPLAIELAAGQLDTLSLKQIVAEERLLNVLVGGDSDNPDHRTLRKSMESSYRRLRPDLQRMWRILSVFEGGMDLAAAQAVCGRMGIDESTVTDLLRELVHKSVLKTVQHPGRRTRYRLLEGTLRQYGLEKVVAAGEDHALRQAHAEYYEALVARGAALWFGPHEPEWLVEKLGAEAANIRPAQRFLRFEGDPELAGRSMDLALNAGGTRFQILGGEINELRRWLANGLAAIPTDPSMRRVGGLSMSAWVAMIQGLQDTARPLLQQAQADARALGCSEDFWPLLHARGTWCWLAETDPREVMKAPALMRRAEQLARESDANPGDIHMIVLFIAIWAAFHADRAVALAETERCLADARAAGADWAISWALWARALAELQHGDPDRAMALTQEALEIQKSINDMWGRAWTLWLIAIVLLRMGESTVGGQMLGGANVARRITDTQLDGLASFRQVQQQAVAGAARDIGPNAFSMQVALGESWTMEEILELAAQLGVLPAGSQPGTRPGGLTDREYEVAELVAKNLSNKAIGDRLEISHRTVEVHVRNIKDKLELSTRVDIARWWPGVNNADSVGVS